MNYVMLSPFYLNLNFWIWVARMASSLTALFSIIAHDMHAKPRFAENMRQTWRLSRTLQMAKTSDEIPELLLSAWLLGLLASTSIDVSMLVLLPS
jgi:hypothetical protein